METTARQWDAAKRNSREKLQKVADAAETSEVRVRVKQAHEAFDAIVAAYDREMLPLLQKGAAVPGPIETIDARIDRRIEDIDKALQWVAKSMSDDNQRAAGEFHAVLLNTNRLGLIVSLVGIGAALSGFAVTTRLIARPLAEMTRAAMEVGKGNYQIELTQQSGGATGALADAFKGMLEEVKRRTAEMERSNEQLLIEVSDRKRAEAQLQQAYDELQATSRVAAMARDIRVGERMSDEDLEEVALVLKMTQSATNARQCGLRLLVEVRRAREVEKRLTA
jgi:HAMP domain-containing protein